MSRAVVTAADREHFRRIAEAEAELNRDSARQAALRSPGDNILLAFELTRVASMSSGSLDRDDEVSPASLWRELQRRRGHA